MASSRPEIQVGYSLAERLVWLSEWQSLGLVLTKKKVYLATLHLREGRTTWRGREYPPYYSFDPDKMKKMSVKQQCRMVLNEYGWIPNKLSYNEIRHSMKIKQVRTYGDVAREFVKKYNKTTKSMKLSKKQRMPKNYELSDILSLSRFVNNLSPRSVKKLLNSMDEDTLKQILVNNMNYYLDANNREKYLNHMDPHNFEKTHLHHSVLQPIKKRKKMKQRKNKLNYVENRFDKLCLELSSYILSFCDQSDVSLASMSCHTLFKASTLPNARTVVTINAQKLARKSVLFQDTIKKRYSTQSIILKKTAKGLPKRIERYFSDIMDCGKLKSLSMGDTDGKLASRALKVCENQKICNIETFHSTESHEMNLPNNLLFNLKTLRVRHLGLNSLNNIQRLLINNIARSDPVIDINADRPDTITKYLNPLSKLRQLEIFDSAKCPLVVNDQWSHPIFWLWNAKNLEKATFCIDFDETSNFAEECQLLLKHSGVQQVAKQQKSFTELTVYFCNFDKVGIDDWKNMISWIPSLYPNLQKIIYAETRLFKGHLAKELDWKFCFGNMRYIEFDIAISMDTAMGLMKSVRKRTDGSFKNLRAFKLKQILLSYQELVAQKRLYNDCKVNLLKVKHFVEEFEMILNNKPLNLVSIVLKCKHRKFERDIFYPYDSWERRMCLVSYKNVLSIIEKNSSFSGYLSFGFPRVRFKYPDVWSEANLDHSLEIAQIIQKIKTKMNKNQDERKLIVELKNLRLNDEHSEYLDFWFGFNKIDYFKQKYDTLCFTMPYSELV